MRRVRYDPTRAGPAHNDTVYVQEIFGRDEMAGRIGYGCCWAILKPGMAVEPHSHPSLEVYVFTRGEGVMAIGEERQAVRAGDTVLIPRGAVHSAANAAEAAEDLAWFSLGVE
jgi:mannose-6-phosphate isomerase-like protein (cupin superfamily)